MIRLAIVGCRNMGKKHLEIIRENFSNETEVVGILNSTKESTVAVATEVGVKALESLDDINKDSVDAVIVATPAENHFATAANLIKKQIPLLVEKPFAATLKEALKLKEMAEEFNTPILVGHTENYNPAVDAVIKDITLPVKKISGIRTSCNPGFKKALVISELMIHDLAIVNSFTDEKPIKKKVTKRKEYRWDEDAIVEMTYANGMEVCLRATRANVERERQMEIVDAKNNTYEIEFLERRASKNGAILPCTGDSLVFEMADFLNMVKTGSNPRVSVDEACRCVEICEALEKNCKGVLGFWNGNIRSAQI